MHFILWGIVHQKWVRKEGLSTKLQTITLANAIARYTKYTKHTQKINTKHNYDSQDTRTQSQPKEHTGTHRVITGVLFL